MRTNLSFYLLMLLLIVGLSSCEKEELLTDNKNSALISTTISANDRSADKPIKIAILGGISYLDPSLMVDCLGEGSDFMNVLSEDNVIQEFCKPLLDETLPQILAEKPDLLLIPGELSFNGEKISHEAVAQILKNLSKQEIKVFLIPGNKDINNPNARAYYGNGSTPTPTITDEEFVKLYKDFGYKDVISRDPNSLSYLIQAFNNVWILGIDSRVYPISLSNSGAIKPLTMEWIKYWLAKAQEKNIIVLPLCHFNVVEPFLQSAIYAGGYMIKNHDVIENELTTAGLRVILTPTIHDIVMHSGDGNDLYNISTGLLVTPPFQFRMITMSQDFMQVETRQITSINATIPGGVDFLEYSNTTLRQRLTRLLTGIFMSSYSLPLGDISTPGTAAYYAPHFANAMSAYYAGDETFPPEEEEVSQEWPEPFKKVLRGFYTDLPPADRQYTVPLK